MRSGKWNSDLCPVAPARGGKGGGKGGGRPSSHFSPGPFLRDSAKFVEKHVAGGLLYYIVNNTGG